MTMPCSRLCRLLRHAATLGLGGSTSLAHAANANWLYKATPAVAATLLAFVLLALLLVQLGRQTRMAEAADRLSRAMLDHSPQLIALLDADGRVLRMNNAAKRWVGESERELMGQLAWLHPAWQHDIQQAERLREAIAQAVEGQRVRMEATLALAGKPARHVEIGLRILPTDTPNRRADILLEARDVTQRKLVEDKLRLAATVLDNAREGVLIADVKGQVLSVNNAFARISGHAPHELVGQPARRLAPRLRDRLQRRRILSALSHGGAWEGEVDCLRPNGHPYTVWISLTIGASHSGQGSYLLVLINDITDWKQAQSQIRRQARFDALTDLPNRESFLERLQWALSGTSPLPLAVLRLNLDQFHAIAHHFSYETGDRVLIEVGRRLRLALREADTVARLGAEEFAVLLPATQAEGASQVASKLMDAVAQPCHIDTHDLALTLSVGIALAPADGHSGEELMRAANAAIQRAREDGQGGCRFHDPGTEQRSLRHLELEAALRKAIPRGELLLHYQPQLMAGSERVVGVEALVRWRHPELGMISPGEFIPLAENTGQIAAVGDWVMREAARQMADWMAQGMSPLVVAVNLSALQFRDPQLIEKVSAVLEETGLPPGCLELELTESVATQNPAAAVAMMDGLHAMGVRLAIDDFGTGYSSLSYLKRFRIHTLKIDQSFVRDISSGADDRAIVRAIIDMSRALNLTTVAEGVETDAQAAFLREGGCTVVQGYRYCRPQDAATIRLWLERHLMHAAPARLQQA
ncbi:MAG: EAL domain-containing protein [Proteobacteria bacterium]|nr:EAL domain-containing protein [Pseudomonadota bacterium]